MEPLFKDRKRRVIKGKEELKFFSYSAYHLVRITARAKGEKQLGQGATDDEDLTVEIDGKTLPNLNDPGRLVDSPAAFSGGNLHDLAKTIYLLTFLKGRNHSLVLNADDPPGTATFESLAVNTLNLNHRLTINVQDQAEDGDRRPWLTFVLADLALKSFSTSLTLKRRFIDSDDVKVIIDEKVKRNHRSIFHKFWYFIASAFTGENRSETFLTNLSPSTHYLEFYADRMPTLHDIVLDFGVEPPTPLGVPTVNAPVWTNDFYDDTETMLLARVIYGEAGGESSEAKVAVGWAVRNRVEDTRQRWGGTYHDVILAEDQYAALWDKNTYGKVRNPFVKDNLVEEKAWQESYTAAGEVIHSEAVDPTGGATFFHSTDYPQERFVTYDVPEAIFLKRIGDFLFYKK